MASNDPPFPPLAIILLGAIISASTLVFVALGADGNWGLALVAVTSGIGGIVTLVGVIAAGVELGMKRASFRR